MESLVTTGKQFVPFWPTSTMRSVRRLMIKQCTVLPILLVTDNNFVSFECRYFDGQLKCFASPTAGDSSKVKFAIDVLVKLHCFFL
jgi:hypothetical protein